MKSASLPRAIVLIDAENMPSGITSELFAEISRLCEPIGIRIYGDARKQEGWVKACTGLGGQWVQTFPQTGSKNASDIALVVDAMDLMQSRRFQGFCILSSDSDFTRLVLPLREEGLWVCGIGKNNTPSTYRSACHTFVCIDGLIASNPKLPIAQPATKPHTAPVKAVASSTSPKRVPATTTVKRSPSEAVPILVKAIARTRADKQGWVQIGPLGSTLSKDSPQFTSKHYGHASLSKLIGALAVHFDLDAHNKALIKVRAKSN